MGSSYCMNRAVLVYLSHSMYVDADHHQRLSPSLSDRWKKYEMELFNDRFKKSNEIIKFRRHSFMLLIKFW